MPSVEDRNPTRHVQQFVEYYARHATDALRTLLEERHLYQTVEVETSKSAWAAFLAEGGTLVSFSLGNKDFSGWAELDWYSAGTATRDHVPGAPQATDLNNIRVVFTPPTIKVYCSLCARLEPHNFQEATVCGESALEPGRPAEQTFAFSYECQSCKGAPAIFLVRRRGTKLTLCGRAPMEEIEVASHVPKNVRSYFRKAVVAAHCGHALGAIAYLRVCIEQFVRELTGLPEERDLETVFDAYHKVLDPVVRDRCPSLNATYADLSEWLHAADESEPHFEAAAKHVDEHFRGREAVARMKPSTQ
jgi:hypothetical protein